MVNNFLWLPFHSCGGSCLQSWIQLCAGLKAFSLQVRFWNNHKNLLLQQHHHCLSKWGTRTFLETNKEDKNQVFGSLLVSGRTEITRGQVLQSWSKFMPSIQDGSPTMLRALVRLFTGVKKNSVCMHWHFEVDKILLLWLSRRIQN